ncbi:hypothetical protein WMY93_026259 [Mugilogobius chulae]|uniref:Tripartite motif-containing protein 16-like n=1 Tax=Mugilogobius chulae TaxID=88201 RepID=A0AAW0N7Y3_9GOBI
MAQSSVDPAALSCSVCLDNLQKPVTIPCGHSYCNSCIHSYWDTEETERSLNMKEPIDKVLDEVSPEPSCRKDFLRYAQDITMDLNTASKHLTLSDGNRRVSYVQVEQRYPDHPDRFSVSQALSVEELTGRCYFEVEWDGLVLIAAAYKDSERHRGFGNSDKSWVFYGNRENGDQSFVFNKVESKIPGPVGSRIGVYLDHSAGALSFYSVQGETMKLLHKVHTQFTRPLHAGVWVHDGSTAHIRF